MSLISPTVGDLFPADDRVAQWVFTLSAVAEDLAITEAGFQDALHSDGSPRRHAGLLPLSKFVAPRFGELRLARTEQPKMSVCRAQPDDRDRRA
jgi:hypothetical protein